MKFFKIEFGDKGCLGNAGSGLASNRLFGAATSALISSKLLNLTLEQSLNAVGIAASMGAGLSQNIGNMTMSLHAGNASRMV